MVASASRVLATVLASIVVMLCAPVLPYAALPGLPAPASPAHGPAMHAAEFGSQAMVVPNQDSASISKALAKWGGDQRPVTRDLPDGLVPEQSGLPDPGGPWGRGALPEAVAAPERVDGVDLPFGRAPPRAVPA